MNINEFYIKSWGEDKTFSGIVAFTDPHNKEVYSRKFYINFPESDFKEEQTVFNYFNDCLGTKLAVDIDVNNNDEVIDFKLEVDTFSDFGNNPKFEKYTIQLISTYPEKNKILLPIKNQPPYLIAFEPPFTSGNTRQYFNGVKNELDVFYEFEPPFEKYNFFLNNLLTYKGRLGNNTDDYFLISMYLDNKTYYGWIKFKLKVQDCEVEILDTYLNSVENERVSVN